MVYYTDLAYVDYFENAYQGVCDNSLIQDRLKAIELSACIILIGGCRETSRVVKLINEITKIIFYSLASLFPSPPALRILCPSSSNPHLSPSDTSYLLFRVTKVHILI